MTDTIREPSVAEIQRWEAEAFKFRAEGIEAQARTDARTAEAEKFRAEAAHHKAQTAAQNEFARFQKSNADITSIQAAQLQRQEEMSLAQDVHHHLYQFFAMVDFESVSNCMATLSYWHRKDPDCDIEIRFTSPGGNVIAGFVLFDYIQELKRQGHKVTTSTLGMAASMAGILLQAGTHRVMGREAWLLIHEGSVGFEGTAGAAEDFLKQMERVRERIVNIFVSRASQASDETATEKLTADRLREGWSRKDWYLTSDESLKYGLVDEVR